MRLENERAVCNPAGHGERRIANHKDGSIHAQGDIDADAPNEYWE
jgi:hypothetical protein